LKIIKHLVFYWYFFLFASFIRMMSLSIGGSQHNEGFRMPYVVWKIWLLRVQNIQLGFRFRSSLRPGIYVFEISSRLSTTWWTVNGSLRLSTSDCGSPHSVWAFLWVPENFWRLNQIHSAIQMPSYCCLGMFEVTSIFFNVLKSIWSLTTKI